MKERTTLFSSSFSVCGLVNKVSHISGVAEMLVNLLSCQNDTVKKRLIAINSLFGGKWKHGTKKIREIGEINGGGKWSGEKPLLLSLFMAWINLVLFGKKNMKLGWSIFVEQSA